MKKLIVISFFLMVAFAACEKNEYVPSYTSSGSIEKIGDLNNDFIVNLDNGKVLTPIENYNTNIVADGDRVLVSYSVIEEKSALALDVNIYDINNILTKGIIQLTTQNNDSIGNDPVHTSDEDIWITDKHLNVVFSYFGLHETHFINLVKPIGDPTYDDEGRLILELRHNANGDSPDKLLSAIVSFEMESLRIADEDSIYFVVRVNDLEDEVYEYKGSFTFESSHKSSSINLPSKNFLNLPESNIK